MTDSEVIAVRASAVSIETRRRIIFVSIVAAAAALRLYGLSLYPLSGDEYGTIAEARQVGLNWNSIVYSALMHFWISLGSSEFWLRLPAAVFGTLTVAVLFKCGEKLGGRRMGIVAGLLGATSPFNLYHSQEVRFYSFFILAASVFLLATLSYRQLMRTWRGRLLFAASAAGLFFAHFLGPLALYVQGGSAAQSAARSKRAKWILATVLVGVPLLGCALLLIPDLHPVLWRIYQKVGNAPSSAVPVTTPISLFSLAKVAFSGFIFVFGYHVYPLRILLVGAGLVLTVFLLLIGTRKLWKDTRWGALPLVYLAALLLVFVVLDAVGGRVANGVSSRHVAFVWPIFVIVTAAGVAALRKPVLYVVVAALLSMNAVSVRAGWQQEWSYSSAVNYREAAEYASRWITKDAAILHDGRSQPPIEYYFPKGVRLIHSWPYIENRALVSQLSNQRLIVVTDDWEPHRRRQADQLMQDLSSRYTVVDGRVDYPLFQYVLEPKAKPNAVGYTVAGASNQVQLPVSNYGLEFQDLKLPVSAVVGHTRLQVTGGYGLPDLNGSRDLEVGLLEATRTKQIVLVTNLLDATRLRPGQAVAELVVTDKSGLLSSIPIRIGEETMPWDQQCASAALCRTVFEWRKRVAIVGQNRYDGALRDFSAGLHGVVLNLPASQEITKLNIHYTADSGRLFLWALALPNS